VLFEKITWRERHSFFPPVHNTLQEYQAEEDSIGGKVWSGDMHTKFCPENLKTKNHQEDPYAGTITKLN
jgi:hypothetical protein